MQRRLVGNTEDRVESTGQCYIASSSASASRVNWMESSRSAAAKGLKGVGKSKGKARKAGKEGGKGRNQEMWGGRQQRRGSRSKLSNAVAAPFHHSNPSTKG
eukprot:351171-Chlamydomonas_euryale.AAC.5